MEDPSNLISVAQFLALSIRINISEGLIVEMFKGFGGADFADALEQHKVLASLPCQSTSPQTMTTSWYRRLLDVTGNPSECCCQWNKAVKNYVKDNQPSSKKSLATTHGSHRLSFTCTDTFQWQSRGLTEDDYMDFLVNNSTDGDLIPLRLPGRSRALLLFIGYRITDWNFRVLLRSFARFMESAVTRLNVAVMLVPAGSEAAKQKAQDYLTKYYENIDVRVYWGTAKDFLRELQERWVQSGNSY